MGLFVDGRNKTPMSPTMLGHNTVMVDGSQPAVHNNVAYPFCWTEPFTAEFSEMRECEGTTTVSLEGSIYDGVVQKRTLALTRHYLVDVFELRSETARTYDYLLHGFGEVALAGAGKMESGHHLGEQYGLGPIDSTADADDENNIWLSAADRAAPDGDWQAVFRDVDGAGVRAFVAAGAGTEVFLTTVPCFVGSPARLPLLIVRRAGRETNFVVVHQPFSGDAAPLRVERQGNELLISGEGFADSFDLAAMVFRPSSA